MKRLFAAGTAAALAGALALAAAPITASAVGPIVVTVTMDGNPVYPGQQACFSFTVNDDSGPIDSGRVSYRFQGGSFYPDQSLQFPHTGCVRAEGSGGAGTIVVNYIDGMSILASGTATVQVIPSMPVQLELTTSPTAIVFGETSTVTLNALSLSEGNIPVPSGYVEFRVNDGYHSTVNLSAGSAAATFDSLPVGTYDVTARYAGRGVYESNTISSTIVVSPAATTLVLTADPDSITAGADVALTATVTSAGGTVSEGTVQFRDDGIAIGAPVPVTGGLATTTTTFPTAANHTLTADFSGATNFAVSTNATTVAVGSVATAVTATTSPSPTLLRAPVTVTATVTSPSGLVPIGNVELAWDGQVFQTTTLDAAGKASFSVVPARAGAIDYTVTFLGNSTFTTATSPSLTHIVSRAATALTLSSSGDSVSGGTTLFTARVTEGDAATAPMPTPSPTATQVVGPANVSATALPSATASRAVTAGQVRFLLDGVEVQAPRTLDANGEVTFSAPNGAAGARTITAEYLGTNDFATTSASVTQTVTAAAKALPTAGPSPEAAFLAAVALLALGLGLLGFITTRHRTHSAPR